MSAGNKKYDLEERLIQFIKDFTKVDKGITECKELISIFVRSRETARKKNRQKTLKHFSLLVICYY